MDDDQAAVPSTIIEGAVLPLDSTGVPNLDLILGGGLIRGTLAIVVGPPGSGKTTLAIQMAFAAARAGRQVLILTALSEPNSKLLSHLRSYDFFDQALIGDQVQVLSLQPFLSSGLMEMADQVIALVREAQGNFVVLDGFSGLRAVSADPLAGRQFLFDIGTTLSAQGATTIITTEAEIRDPRFFPEATTADMIIGMHFSVHDDRQRRRLEVVKARGATPLSGLHGLELGTAGIVVSPRLEARVMHAGRPPLTAPNPPGEDSTFDPGADATDRASFDLPALDELLSGGLTQATTTVVIGSGGTGKTLLGIHFALAGIRAGEPVVFLGFHEDRRQLLLKADAFNLGQDFRAAIQPGGGLTLLHYPPVELDADALADQLLSALDRTGARRLVVDSIAVIERAASEGSTPRRVQNYLSALVVALQARRVTALFTKETGIIAAADLELETDLSSGVAENILWLQGVIYREHFYRVLSVLKMRFSAHDLTLREFTISSPAGIEVRAPLESEAGLLAGITRAEGEYRSSPLVSAGGAQGSRVRHARGRRPPAEHPPEGPS
jgi:circadian clock protein KaiC